MVITAKMAAEICREWYVAFSRKGKAREKCVLELLDAADTIEALEAAQPKWISVEDDLPAHVITPCLIYTDGDIELAVWTHDKYELSWWFHVDGEYETGITHWMPLPSMPEPPKEDA